MRPDGDPNPGEITCFLRSELVEPLVAPAEAKRAAAGPDETRNEILQHLRHATVTATAHLGTLEIPVRDLMNLEPGDVLVLDTRQHEPIPILVAGRTVLRGSPVTSEGRYALRIEDLRRHQRVKVDTTPPVETTKGTQK